MALGDYTKTTYVDGTTEITSAVLNNNEDKTDELDGALDAHVDAANPHSESASMGDVTDALKLLNVEIFEHTGETSISSTGFVNFMSESYTPVSNSSKLIIFLDGDFYTYKSGHDGTVRSDVRITVAGSVAIRKAGVANNGAGSVPLSCIGVYNNTNTNAKQIEADGLTVASDAKLDIGPVAGASDVSARLIVAEIAD